MATEIERKFLVWTDRWRRPPAGTEIRQGYLCATGDRAVRVRIAGRNGYLTIKAARSEASRHEYEYPIPLTDAHEMLNRLCERPLIEKIRYAESVGGREWIVDVFSGENQGLVVAEVELDYEDQPVEMPPWAGTEVTRLARYLNANLIHHPYRQWSPAERLAPDGQTGTA